MKITVRQTPSVPTSANAVIIPYVSDKDFKLPKIPAAARTAIKRYIKTTEYKGKKGEIAFVQYFSGKCSWIVLAGLGESKKIDAESITNVLQQATRTAQKQKSQTTNVVVTEELQSALKNEALGALIAEASIIGSYSFTNKAKKVKLITAVTIITKDKFAVKELKEGVAHGTIIGEATTLVRDYGNLPSNKITPKILAEAARKVAKETGQKVTVLSEKQMEKEKMGGTLGVSKGSIEEAQFIILEHMKGKKGEAPIVLVGKGITFDSGGISIKPSNAMDEMKYDMSGGGTVIGTMQAIGKLKLPINVVGLVPTTENVPSGSAYKPGDVLHYADGTTVEVLNTDAEGRLILGDALIYARRYKPRAIVDLATLTGAMMVALGDSASGFFSNNETLCKQLEASAKEVGEPIWRLPLPEHYAARVQSKVADLQNISNKPYGGSITAAKFLEFFIKKGTPWAHFDIAGTANLGESAGMEQGATGVMVKTLVDYIKKSA